MSNFKSIRCITGIILVVLSFLPSTTSARHQGQCYAADDVNASNTVTIYSNPQELISSVPQTQQVAPWIDTGLISIGGTTAGTFAITGTIRGSWGPLGSAATPCNLVDCNVSNSTGFGSNEVTTICLVQGTPGIQHTGQNVVFTSTTYPCILSNGIGLYMLITDDSNGSFSANYSAQQAINSNDNVAQLTSNALDPNADILSASAPMNGEYLVPTWHMNDYVTSSTNEVSQFAIKSAVKCPMLPSTLQCEEISVPAGRIYLKIVDSYYGDNYGSYTVTFDTGVFQVGFLFRAVQAFDTILSNSSKIIATYVMQALQPIFIIILTFYIMWYGIAFAVGALEVKTHDMVMRMIKLCTMSLLFTPYGLFIVEAYLIDPFWMLGSAMSDIILMSVLFNATTGEIPTLSTAAETVMSKLWYIAVYDAVLNILYSTPINAKIWGILFSLKFYYILLLYALTMVLTLSIFKAVIYSLEAMIRFYLVKMVFPLFMLLSVIPTLEDFLTTLFKQLTVVAITLILVALCSALMITMLDTSFQSLYNYTVCWRSIIDIPVLALVRFFMPTPYAEAKEALKFDVYMYTIVTAALFYELFNKLGGIIDSLSSVTTDIEKMMSGRTEKLFESKIKSKVRSGTYKILAYAGDKTIATPLSILFSPLKALITKLRGKGDQSKISRDGLSGDSAEADTQKEHEAQQSRAQKKKRSDSSSASHQHQHPHHGQESHLPPGDNRALSEDDHESQSHHAQESHLLPGDNRVLSEDDRESHSYSHNLENADSSLFDDDMEAHTSKRRNTRLGNLQHDNENLSVEEKLNKLREQFENTKNRKQSHVNRDGEGSSSEESGEFADREHNVFHENADSAEDMVIHRDSGSMQSKSNRKSSLSKSSPGKSDDSSSKGKNNKIARARTVTDEYANNHKKKNS
ncbi:putative trbL/VirB6 family protein [Candidatus Fokinia solitaria]|uniref:Putative trbL/VirB6 family protein n=1 Tax=Candidatus Fokinia solitaria TaxID=1802984 RepID=A0A2U8BSU9_9RICK|nr:hypothetical protein [Candidatus Fokinia solitaria]AWD33419.1 putative trbL/VirB6 family protein [Candidatus Fokinia solitaria]